MTAQWLVPVIVWWWSGCCAPPLPAHRHRDRRPRDHRDQQRRTQEHRTRPAPDWRRLLTSAAGLAGRRHRAGLHRRGGALPHRGHLLVLTICYALRRTGAAPGARSGRLRRRADRRRRAGADGARPTRCGSSSPARRVSPTGCSARTTSPPTWPAGRRVSPLSVAGRPRHGPADHRPRRVQHLPRAGRCCWSASAARSGCAATPLALACAITALVMAALSLGPEIVVGGNRTGIPGPYALLAGVPVVDGALPMRFALPVLPLLATMLVLALDRARDARRPCRIGGAGGGGRGAAHRLPDAAAHRAAPRTAGVHHRRPLARLRRRGRRPGAGAVCHAPRALADALGHRGTTPDSLSRRASSSARTARTAAPRWAPTGGRHRRCWQRSPAPGRCPPSAETRAQSGPRGPGVLGMPPAWCWPPTPTRQNALRRSLDSSTAPRRRSPTSGPGASADRRTKAPGRRRGLNRFGDRGPSPRFAVPPEHGRQHSRTASGGPTAAAWPRRTPRAARAARPARRPRA